MKPSSSPYGHLTQSEHWFRILAETSPVAVLVCRDKIMHANPAAVALTGYSEAELQTMSLEQLLAPATGETVMQGDRLRWLRRDGEIRLVRCSSAYLQVDWEPAALIMAVDITEQAMAETRLQETRERFLLAQKAARWTTWEWTPTTDRLATSSITDSFFGLEVERRLRSGADFLEIVHPEDRDRLRRAVTSFLRNGDSLSIELRCLTPRGDSRWIAAECTAQRRRRRRIERVIGVAHDVTEKKVTENALFQEKDRAFVTLAAIADGVIRTDARGVVDYLNPVAQRLTGWSLADSYGRPAADLYRVLDEETGRQALDPVQCCLDEQREVVYCGPRLLVRRDGSHLPIHDSAAPIFDRQANLTGCILVFRDLTLMRQVEEEMQHLASHDALTGLANRREFEHLLREVALSQAGKTAPLALCYLDLDAFKLINETCGHSAGDQLIRQIAEVLKQRVGPRDILARVGIDEFAVLLRDRSPDDAHRRAQELCDAIHRYRFHWEGRPYSPRVSAGLAIAGATAARRISLLGAADAACFVAKDSGGGRLHLFESGDTAIAERYGEMQWVSRIQKGFDEHRFCLWRQSIRPLDPASSDPRLSELFIRLIDEQGTVVSPGSFIPAAERYGLIDSIDRWVVKEALRYMSRQGAIGEEGARFAINISGQSLGANGFLDHIIQQIEVYRVAPHRILFEITETSAIANLPNAMRFISVLKEMGCQFVLDDFGQGLSSFSYLKNLPLDFIKIDGSFVREMIRDPIQAALVSSIHDIGAVMGLRTIAESVEDEATFQALTDIGVDFVQGYFLERPEPLTTGSPPALSDTGA